MFERDQALAVFDALLVRGYGAVLAAQPADILRADAPHEPKKTIGYRVTVNHNHWTWQLEDMGALMAIADEHGCKLALWADDNQKPQAEYRPA